MTCDHLSFSFKSLKIMGFGAALSAMVACGSSVPQTIQSRQQSTDPTLVSLISAFREACINSAPNFSEARIRTVIGSQHPRLAPGMMMLASGEEGRSCKIRVIGYGRGRPMPTAGDEDMLGRALHARVGGQFQLSPLDNAGGAKIRLGRTRYNVYAYVTAKGVLNFSVFK